MIHLKQAVIVEGKYDKIKLSSIIDALIITTDGFSVFKNKEKIALIKNLAEKDGVIVLTDSDSAGFKIRNYIKGCTQKGKITNIYIPDIFGKEKRKTKASAEGKLGVEGIDVDILTAAFEKAGITSSDSPEPDITKLTLYELGLSGGKDSSQLRKRLQSSLGLPSLLSAPALTEILGTMMTADELRRRVEKLKEEENGL